MSEKQLEVAPCQVCGSHPPQLFIRHLDYALYECMECRLIYLNPMPTLSEIEQIYDDAYNGTREGYFLKIPQKIRRAHKRVSRISRLIGGGRFLDVGCNGGFMVAVAQEQGFEAYGIDLDAVSISWAKEHYPSGQFVRTRIEEYENTEPFDVIYCSEVIEHVTNANDFVAAIVTRLRPGGFLYLTTPDISHWRRPRDVRRWDAFCPPSHCLYFNPRNLSKLLEKHKLKVYHQFLAFKPGIKLLAQRQN